MDRCLHFHGDVSSEWPVGRVVPALTGSVVCTGSSYDFQADRTTVRFSIGGDKEHGLAAAISARTGRAVRIEP